MARKVVVLPLPDGPTSARISPGSTSSAKSSGMGLCWRMRALRPVRAGAASAMAPADPLRQPVAQRDCRKRYEEEHRRHARRGDVVEGLHPVVNGDGDGACFARNAAADHEDDAELA